MRFRFSNCEFDTDRRELRRAGEVVPVEPQVFELLTCLIANKTAGATVFFAGAAHSRWLPRLISNENGMRNLIDALSHSQ